MKTANEQSTQVGLDNINIVESKKTKKAITAAALGNTIEWFDFGVYGYVAYVLGKVFFPNTSPSLQLIATLATFSVPFIFRPLGGIIFGVLGDKYGRKHILAITIIMMTLSTAAIGLLPTYASIGMWAPILLLILKVLQGVSTGGEYSGAATFVSEYSPDRKRGFMVSWLDFGSIAGFLLGAGSVSLISYIIGEQSFADWGWRIPFLIALPLGAIGLYLRHAVEETPAYKKAAESEEKRISFKEIITHHRRSLLVCVGITITTGVVYYMLLTYLPSYLTHNLHYPSGKSELLSIGLMVLMLFFQLLVGWLSDKIGRRPFIFASSFIQIVLAYPVFMLLTSGVESLIILGMVILALAVNMLLGIMAATLPALFPTEIRYSALATSYNLSIVFVGLTPTVLAMLVESTGNLMIPAYYLMVFGAIGVVTAIYFKETANKPLYGTAPIAEDRAEAIELLDVLHENIEEKVQRIDEKMDELSQKREKLVSQHPELK
ncbi:glycine betaine/L-proline transporter ProP [Acinetobacter nectaris]|uniref:glycine betaine/L-proline transporter ProP n=1 Tax=Acinetobacter nectaris TaxID=1219382 RepID=UPI001EFF9FA6|nr:glycine betaine/L-proline transporter ProP [Acinetobacter nectaris]MCF8998917.1 glycine betaine/L-proline transporter ProP [Acinetobacter nectaris]MCF9027490.1 glycine betaine/L-proline transporter ProP [Acinetobacter nectaris]